MKTILIFLIVSFPIVIWGQTINHFNNIDSKWNVARTKPAGSPNDPGFIGTTTTIYGFQGDTTINAEQWFKMYSTQDSLFLNDLVYRGLIRAENQKVYYLDALNHLDTLYDFNLAMGDSVLFHLSSAQPSCFQIVSVDSIQVNGEFYRRQHFAEPIMIAFDVLNEVWIEGIGSVHGPYISEFPL